MLCTFFWDTTMLCMYACQFPHSWDCWCFALYECVVTRSYRLHLIGDSWVKGSRKDIKEMAVRRIYMRFYINMSSFPISDVSCFPGKHLYKGPPVLIFWEPSQYVTPLSDIISQSMSYSSSPA